MAREAPLITALKEFNLVKVLNVDSNFKICSLLVSTKKDGLQGVVTIEKSSFVEESVEALFSSSDELEKVFQNDVYSQHLMRLPINLGQAKVTVICPCTEKHIRKYSKQSVFCIRETPTDYVEVTQPYLQNHKFDMQWVRNILDGKAEVDRVFYNDPDLESGFMLLPDLKWDQCQIENMYVTGLVRQPIQSLRMLNATHLPLLQKLVTVGKKMVSDKYGVPLCQQRVYFHYQPTYYHLHVHYTHMAYQDMGCQPERAHLVEDVIDNIKCNPQHYATCSLSFLAKELDLLTQEFQKQRPQYFL